jgi:hypothetical protein
MDRIALSMVQAIRHRGNTLHLSGIRTMPQEIIPQCTVQTIPLPGNHLYASGMGIHQRDTTRRPWEKTILPPATFLVQPVYQPLQNLSMLS